MYLAAKKRISTPSTVPTPSSSSQSPTPPHNASKAPQSPAGDGDPASVSASQSPSPQSGSTPASHKPLLKSETPVPIPLPKTSHSAHQAHGQGQNRPQAGSPAFSQAAPMPTKLTSAFATYTPPAKAIDNPTQPPSSTHTEIKPGSLPPAQEPSQSTSNSIQPQGPISETPVPLPPIPGRQANGTTPRATLTVQPPQTLASQVAFHASSDGTSGTVGFPDVPQDSMALIEQMMSSLKRASSSTTTAG